MTGAEHDGPDWERRVTLRHHWGWEMFTVMWNPEVRTGRRWTYQGIIRQRTLRIGKLALSWLSLHTWWKEPVRG